MKAAAMVAACAGLAACGAPTESSYVKTRAMYAKVAVEARDDEPLRAVAQLLTDDAMGSVIELVGTDAWTCDDVALGSAAGDFGLQYEAVVAPAAPHAFTLVRASGAVTAGTIGAPDDFAVTSAPLDGGVASQFTLTWAPVSPSEDISLDVTSTDARCVGFPLSGRVKDVGSFAFSGAAFAESAQAADCVYTLAISREAITPIVGSPLAGGERSSRRIRTTTLHVRAS